jgi:hypothetical protein
LPMFWAPAVDAAPALEIEGPIIPGTNGGDAVVVECLQRFADALAARVMRWPEEYRNWHLIAADAINICAACQNPYEELRNETR